jgi:serine/threonine-protein kinase HipA
MDGIVYVKLWGTIIGALGYKPGQTEVATFEYDDKFLAMGVEISPLHLPLREASYTFDNISHRTFHGLPGFISDSLPDKFGNQLIDQYFAEQGKREQDITALDRLLYIGNRAMGSLEYEPSESFNNDNSGVELNLDRLSELAEMVLTNKDKFREQMHKADRKSAINLLRIGSSAGGARSKALVAVDKDGRFFDGTIDQGKECKYYLLKFDSSNNSDRDKKDPKGMTRVEYIYSLIAKECGIDIPTTKFIEVDDDFHFMIERFDRVYDSSKSRLDKLHYVSWSGMAHAHRDTTGSYSYEQLVLTAREVGLAQDAITEIFKRAVFNIIGRNQDDHTKNFGFLMGRDAQWRLAPAFDMTYSYDPAGKWTKVHQIKFQNKQDGFTLSDIINFGNLCNINEKKVKEIVKQTQEEFSNFEALADEYKVDDELKTAVLANIRKI